MESNSSEQCSFGKPTNIPFLFNIPHPQPTSQAPTWAAQDIPDIQMSDPSPARSDVATQDETPARPVSLVALKRVRKHREQRLARRNAREREAGYESDSTVSDEEHRPVKHSTTRSTHYTLNMPGPGYNPSHLPYTLLG